MIKCQGCGAILQDDNPLEEGYTKLLENKLCERCFRINHYNDYQKSLKTNADFLPILNEIKKKNDLVIVVIDLFHTISIDHLCNYLNNDILLVLTKRDLLPYSLYEEKISQYFRSCFSNIKDTVIISSETNYHYDELYQAILKYQKSKNVYVVGYTNAGKSTMINRLLYHYSNNDATITTSILPSTTLNTIEIELNDNLKFIDTPGILEESSIICHLDKNDLKRVIPKKEIKPKIYQIRKDTYFKLDKFIRLGIHSKGSIVFYFSNSLVLERLFKEPKDVKNYQKKEITVLKDHDLVITGMGFIKVKQDMKITLYISDNIHYHIRESYI